MSRRRLIYFEDRHRLVVSGLVERAADGAVVATVGWGEGVGSGWGVDGGIELMTGSGGVAGETTLETVGETLERWKTS